LAVISPVQQQPLAQQCCSISHFIYESKVAFSSAFNLFAAVVVISVFDPIVAPARVQLVGLQLGKLAKCPYLK
jgi:hypothetical protein